ncbi:23S rRNA (guanosine(2251)-2'-O)-methyltransferase RlmB [[Mycoplasma] gypis]|uniref:23S rRNA (Guanosine(2251)-2'-O)-methyltransferase RlmB n=1 Tax=[Mycoplasma] gypis TaxID=92404 RepID=A0ABZ2RMM1_9BACT|nr:23S rRNA (guanosine(2251)-2'-O)-methyltransferase RlmB [[Mycoplasma] gypis]MBN0919080.1 23S rRNA (guanosine(2251)-2'-O)-methyltransferase RlmB [[Mycoplasma] gypis]
MKQEFIYGKNSVLDALEQNFPISELWVQENINFQTKFKNVKRVSREKLNTITDQNHQGFIAFIKPYQYAHFEQLLKHKPENVLILDHIQDVQNLGAIIRSANVFGINWIIIPSDRAASVTPTVLKIASGGINNMNIIKANSLLPTINSLKKEGYWVYVTALNENAKQINETKFNTPSVLVIGNEEKGVSSTILKNADEVIYIPQKGNVQSLNASVATGIALYCLVNQKN